MILTLPHADARRHGSDLRCDDPGVRRVGADRAEAEEGVAFLGEVQVRDRLVAADIEGADDHRARAGQACRRGEDLGLLVLGGRLRAVHEQQLGAEEADAFGARGERVLHLGERRDVGADLDAPAVGRRGVAGGRALDPLPDRPQRGALRVVELRHRGRGIGDHQAPLAVDDDLLPVPQGADSVGDADDAGDAEGTGEDHGVRGGAAAGEDEPLEAGLVEGEEVRGAQGLGDDDGVAREGDAVVAGRAGIEGANEELPDVAQVEHALGEHGAAGIAQDRGKVLHGRGHGLSGAGAAAADLIGDLRLQFDILEDGEMRVENRALSVVRGGGTPRPQRGADLHERPFELRELRLGRALFTIGEVRAAVPPCRDEGRRPADAAARRTPAVDTHALAAQGARQGRRPLSRRDGGRRFVAQRQLHGDEASQSLGGGRLVAAGDQQRALVPLPGQCGDQRQRALGVRLEVVAAVGQGDRGLEGACRVAQEAGGPGVEAVRKGKAERKLFGH